MKEVDYKILSEIYKILEKLNACEDILSVMGSYKDTLDDDTVLEELKRINKKHILINTNPN